MITSRITNVLGKVAVRYVIIEMSCRLWELKVRYHVQKDKLSHRYTDVDRQSVANSVEMTGVQRFLSTILKVNDHFEREYVPLE